MLAQNLSLTMVCKDGRQEPLAITAPTQNAGFRASKDTFVQPKVQFSE